MRRHQAGGSRRALLDVDVTRPEIDDPKRREFCYNGIKHRRIIGQFCLDGLINRRNDNNQVKLNEVATIINPFSLAKFAYMKCSQKEKEEYDSMQTPDVDVKSCCYLLKENSSDVMKHAISNKHTECFIHGHVKGYSLPYWSCYSAIAHEAEGILKYAHENGCDFVGEIACKEAAINGYLPCLEYIHKVGGELTTDLMKAVIIHGSTECLKYLLQNGCEWTIDMCALSANSGDLDFVKFCQANGCPWVIIDSTHWYLLIANLGILKDSYRNPKLLDLAEDMKRCARYIESTAVVWEGCELRKHAGIRIMSITL